MNRCQQCQQAGAEQLRRRKMTGPSGTGLVRKKQVDQIVWDVWRQLFEQCRKAGLWKLIHMAISYPKNPTCRSQRKFHVFLVYRIEAKKLAPHFVTPSNGVAASAARRACFSMDS